MILCCGEALIDMVPETTVGGATGFVPYCGGAVFNTAIGLGRLGIPAGMVSGISYDQFGEQLVAALRESGVNCDALIRSDRLTTLAMVQLTDGHATYTFYDENSAGRMIGVEDLPELGSEVQAFYFGGISLCVEPAADSYAALAEREAAGRLVMLDPNIRPSFILDETRHRARLAKVIGVSDIIKVSSEDLDWLFPEASDLDSQVAEVLAMTPGSVIVTKGGEGSCLYLQGGEQVHAGVEIVDVVDTIGAGDTFNAGFLAKLHDLGLLSKAGFIGASHDELQQALEFGARVAGVTVSRAGANPPWRHELE